MKVDYVLSLPGLAAAVLLGQQTMASVWGFPTAALRQRS